MPFSQERVFIEGSESCGQCTDGLIDISHRYVIQSACNSLAESFCFLGQDKVIFGQKSREMRVISGPAVLLNLDSISILPTTLVKRTWAGIASRFQQTRLAQAMQGKRMDVWVTLALALFVLVTRGANGEGQSGVFNTVIREYIEETSASLGHIILRPTEIIDINTLAAFDSKQMGQGGESLSASPVEPSTVQQNSLLAFTPTSENYLDQASAQRSQVIEYTVQPGDLVSFIASDYAVSVNSILWANGIKDADTIQPGQVLKIPPVSGVVHTIKKGDTLAALAKKYSADESKILAFNGLPQDGQLRVNDEIIIPDGKIQAPATISRTTAVATSLKSTKLFSYLPDLGSFFMLPTSGFNWGKIHGRNGVDIANSCGTPIYAAGEGTVATADETGWNGGFGKYIKMSHANGTETIYAHASKLKVEKGQNVEKGQIIALMGTTGRSTGCHLHFEVHGARNPLAKY